VAGHAVVALATIVVTDRYPPFTLADDPSYPARLDIAYPQRLSRGLALVKWWLLAIPHYIIVGVFTGGGLWAAGQLDRSSTWPGLIGILAMIAAVALLFTGRYPRQLFDLIVGLDRWVLRVAAYAGLMTDAYPPFRLDQGGHEPGTLTMPPGPGAEPGLPVEPAPPRQPGWTGGRVACAIAGAVLVAVSLGLHADTAGWQAARALFGTVRLTASPAAGQPVFLGIAPTERAAAYLAGSPYVTVRDITSGHVRYTAHQGTVAPAPPGQTGIWAARSAGSGPQALTWQPRNGRWTVVAMNADGSRPVSVRVAIAATLPALPWVAAGLLIAGILMLTLGVTLIIIPARRATALAAVGGPR